MARPTQTFESFQAKRHKIVDAAIEILERDGAADKITLRSIAKILNWSYSTPYRYFDSKEALLVAIRIRAFSMMEYDLKQAISAKKANSKNLERLTHAYINAALQRPSLYHLMFYKVSAGETDGDLLKELDQIKKNCLDVCAETMRESQIAGELSNSVDPITAAHIFWVSAHGTVSLELAGQLVMGRDLQSIAHSLLNVVLNGLQSSLHSSEYFQKHSLREQLSLHN